MAKTISPRFGLTRWSDGPDPWSRAEIDANFGALEGLALASRTGLAAERNVPARDRELFIASDTGAVSLGRVAGGAWADLGRIGAAQTWSALQTYSAGVAADVLAATKRISGPLATVTFATEAGRDDFYANNGGLVGIPICYLTAPTTGKPGLYLHNGTRWTPLRGYGFQQVLGAAWAMPSGVNAAGNNQSQINAWGAVPGVVGGLMPPESWDTTGGAFSRGTGIWTVAVPGTWRVTAHALVSINPAAPGVSNIEIGVAHRPAGGAWRAAASLRGNTPVAAGIGGSAFGQLTVSIPEGDLTLAANDQLSLNLSTLGTGSNTAPAGSAWWRAELVAPA